MAEIIFKTKDHPEANGRQPAAGEVEYGLHFSLENGDILRVKMGREGFQVVTDILFDMLSGAEPYNDGSIPDEQR